MRRAGALAAYLLIAGLYTWPLLPLSTTRIAGNAYDPILTTSILWWNATTVPFTERWWNPPYYYPDHGVTTFTENLLGVSVFASPIFWVTHNPLTAHNLSLYLAWPLSAFGVYLLVEFLTRRRDAAFLAGLAFGFTPYRTAELGHIQMVSSYWLPLALLGLHRYLDDRRMRWLVLFGAAFVLQTLANLYMLFYGGVLIVLWLAYFCVRRGLLRALAQILVAWGLALLVLMPVLLRYRAVHDVYNMHRLINDFLGFILPIDAWLQVSGVVWLWRHVLPDSDHNLFPGVVALMLVAVAFVRAIAQPAPNITRAPGWMRWTAWILGALCACAVLYTAFAGPWRIAIGGLVLRMTNLTRALVGFAIAGGVLLWPLARLRMALARRSLWVFYAAATIAMAMLTCGPEVRVTETVMIRPAPYAWLVPLPGFDELRVPTRFWILGVLCLSITAGLSFSRIVQAESRRRVTVAVLIGAALLVDGWACSIPMAEPPAVWPEVEAAGVARPILELPLGPDWDTAATFRSIAHRRPVWNGASGYEPQHYAPLLDGLTARDPEMLRAIGIFGAFDVVIDSVNDPDGDWTRYVSSFPGVSLIAKAGGRAAYRVPASEPADGLGPRIPIASVESSNLHDASRAIDGRVDTDWWTHPQYAGDFITADLGAVHEVTGVSHALGDAARDFPRRLAIDVSLDGVSWTQVWEGTCAGEAFRAAVEAPLEAAMHFRFARQAARFVRLRLTTNHKNVWHVSELQVHGSE